MLLARIRDAGEQSISSNASSSVLLLNIGSKAVDALADLDQSQVAR